MFTDKYKQTAVTAVRSSKVAKTAIVIDETGASLPPVRPIRSSVVGTAASRAPGRARRTPPRAPGHASGERGERTSRQPERSAATTMTARHAVDGLDVVLSATCVRACARFRRQIEFYTVHGSSESRCSQYRCSSGVYGRQRSAKKTFAELASFATDYLVRARARIVASSPQFMCS